MHKTRASLWARLRPNKFFLLYQNQFYCKENLGTAIVHQVEEVLIFIFLFNQVTVFIIAHATHDITFIAGAYFVKSRLFYFF
jgi:hypothetical protein